MSPDSSTYLISGILLLVGAATFGFSRSAGIGVLLRPMKWCVAPFGLGIWALFGASLSGTQSFVVPLAMTITMLWGIRPDRDPVPLSARKLGARFVSIGFLVLLGVSDDLIILFFALEAACLAILAKQAWDSPLPNSRRVMLARTFGSLFLIAAGVTLISSHLGTTSLTSIESQLADRWERSSLMMADTHNGSKTMQISVVLLLTGCAWRLSFFPFATLSNREGYEELASDFQIVQMFSISIFLAVVIPRLIGGFELSQILLVTFGLSTLVKETSGVIRAEFLEDSIRKLLSSSAALIWIILAIGLQGAGAEPSISEGYRFPGEVILIFELAFALAASLLLERSVENQSDGHAPGVRREQLTGLIERAPASALLSMLLILVWTGWFAIQGRWELLFEGFRIAASNQTAAEGYFLVSSVVLIGVAVQQLFALRVCQTICSRGWNTGKVAEKPREQHLMETTSPRPMVFEHSSER